MNFSSFYIKQEIADGIQDLLICMEMLVAVIAFLNSFPISEFYPFPSVSIKKKIIARKEKDKDVLIPTSRSLVYNKFMKISEANQLSNKILTKLGFRLARAKVD